MVRPAVFLSLAFATLVGPLLCCCTLARAFSSTVASQTPETTAAVPEQEPACPHCRAAAFGAGMAPSRPNPPLDPSQSCPCCAERLATVAIAQPVASPLPPDLPLVAVLAIDSDVITDGATSTCRVGDSPGSEVQAFLLDSCHRLRC
jgi:hypothetical protein